MGKRGRPPHRDILTPREREVLELLRERLTNEQIAARLGITLDGAKYHVSEILSKLGVSSREEAAGWQTTEMRPLWMRLIALPTAAKIVGALTLIVVAAGLAVLAWGVAKTSGPPQQESFTDWSDLPTPGGDPVLTRDAALLMALRGPLGPDIMPADATVVLTTFEGARRAANDPGDFPEGPAADTATWLIRLRGMFTGRAGALSSGPGSRQTLQAPTVPTIECRDVVVFFADDGPSYLNSDGSPGLVQVGPDNRPSSASCPSETPGGTISRDYALIAAAFNPLAQVHPGPPPVRDTSAELMTYSQALSWLTSGGWNQPLLGTGPDSQDDVWLVFLKGPFVPPPEEIPPSPPGPSAMRLICTETVSLIDATSGTVVHTEARTSSSCLPRRRGDQSTTLAQDEPPALDQRSAIEAALRQAGIPPGQEPTSVDARPSSFTNSLGISYWFPPTERPKTVWIVTLTGLMTRPLDPEAPATPPPSELRCSDLVTIVSGDTGNLFASIFQHADSCS